VSQYTRRTFAIRQQRFRPDTGMCRRGLVYGNLVSCSKATIRGMLPKGCVPMNIPPAKAGGVGIRLKAGSVGHPADYPLPTGGEGLRLSNRLRLDGLGWGYTSGIVRTPPPSQPSPSRAGRGKTTIRLKPGGTDPKEETMNAGLAGYFDAVAPTVATVGGSVISSAFSASTLVGIRTVEMMPAATRLITPVMMKANMKLFMSPR